MDFSKCMENIKNSYLPLHYQEKLCYDLERIGESGIDGVFRIVLFGSCARNQIRVGSDIDLLVVTEKMADREIRGELASDLAEEKQGVATDVIFYTREDFERSECLLVREIKKDGLILWEG